MNHDPEAGPLLATRLANCDRNLPAIAAALQFHNAAQLENEASLAGQDPRTEFSVRCGPSPESGRPLFSGIRPWRG
jgi:hypothetical protein